MALRGSPWPPIRPDDFVPLAHGKLQFHTAGADRLSSPFAHYVVIRPDDSAAEVLEWCLEHWNLKRKPEVLFSMTGGVRLPLSPKHRRVFKEGFSQCAGSIYSWVTTGGTDSGVMALASEAISEGSVETPVIGIAAFRMVQGCEELGRHHGWMSPEDTVHYFHSGASANSAALNAGHSHFILVDGAYGNMERAVAAGYRRRWGEETDVREALEKQLHHDRTVAVLLVLSGGPVTLSTVRNSVRAKMPVILFEGTQRMADVLALIFRAKDRALLPEGLQSVTRALDVRDVQEGRRGHPFPAPLLLSRDEPVAPRGGRGEGLEEEEEEEVGEVGEEEEEEGGEAVGVRPWRSNEELGTADAGEPEEKPNRMRRKRSSLQAVPPRAPERGGAKKTKKPRPPSVRTSLPSPPPPRRWTEREWAEEILSELAIQLDASVDLQLAFHILKEDLRTTNRDRLRSGTMTEDELVQMARTQFAGAIQVVRHGSITVASLEGFYLAQRSHQMEQEQQQQLLRETISEFDGPRAVVERGSLVMPRKPSHASRMGAAAAASTPRFGSPARTSRRFRHYSFETVLERPSDDEGEGPGAEERSPVASRGTGGGRASGFSANPFGGMARIPAPPKNALAELERRVSLARGNGAGVSTLNDAIARAVLLGDEAGGGGSKRTFVARLRLAIQWHCGDVVQNWLARATRNESAMTGELKEALEEALMFAAQTDNDDIVEVLLEEGTDAGALDIMCLDHLCHGLLPLHHAAALARKAKSHLEYLRRSHWDTVKVGMNALRATSMLRELAQSMRRLPSMRGNPLVAGQEQDGGSSPAPSRSRSRPSTPVSSFGASPEASPRAATPTPLLPARSQLVARTWFHQPDFIPEIPWLLVFVREVLRKSRTLELCRELLQGLRASHVTVAMGALRVVWAIQAGKFRVARLLWRLADHPLRTVLLACELLRERARVSTTDKVLLETEAAYFESVAVNLVYSVVSRKGDSGWSPEDLRDVGLWMKSVAGVEWFLVDVILEFHLVGTGLPLLGGGQRVRVGKLYSASRPRTMLHLAERADCKTLISTPIVQYVLDNLWRTGRWLRLEDVDEEHGSGGPRGPRDTHSPFHRWGGEEEEDGAEAEEGEEEDHRTPSDHASNTDSEEKGDRSALRSSSALSSPHPPPLPHRTDDPSSSRLIRAVNFHQYYHHIDAPKSDIDRGTQRAEDVAGQRYENLLRAAEAVSASKRAKPVSYIRAAVGDQIVPHTVSALSGEPREQRLRRRVRGAAGADDVVPPSPPPRPPSSGKLETFLLGLFDLGGPVPASLPPRRRSSWRVVQTEAESRCWRCSCCGKSAEQGLHGWLEPDPAAAHMSSTGACSQCGRRMASLCGCSRRANGFFLTPRGKYVVHALFRLLFVLWHAAVILQAPRAEVQGYEVLLFLWWVTVAVDDFVSWRPASGQKLLFWDALAVVLHLVFLLSAAVWVWGRASDSMTVVESAWDMLSVGFLLSVLRLMDTLSVLPEVGPLTIIIGKIVVDDLRLFAILVVLVLGGFGVSFASLFVVQRGHRRDWDQVENYLWSMLGDWTLPIEVEGQGKLLAANIMLALYLLATIVLINLLIAMMADSYRNVRDNSDVEHKFTRARHVWHYLQTTALPPPLNVLEMTFIGSLRVFGCLPSDEDSSTTTDVTVGSAASPCARSLAYRHGLCMAGTTNAWTEEDLQRLGYVRFGAKARLLKNLDGGGNMA